MSGPRPPDRLSWNIASITAHRDLAADDMPVIHEAMRGLVLDDTLDAIYFGGARGGDNVALQAALYFRGPRPRPWLTVVVPDRVQNQPVETHFWTRKADEVIELCNRISKNDRFRSYTIRDRYLVDVASYLVALFNGNYKSGTGKTVAMAEKDGVMVQKVPIIGLSQVR